MNALFIAAALVLVFNPNAKAWFLQKLMLTGLFTAHIDNTQNKPGATGEISSLGAAGDFSFRAADGRVMQLSELNGKVVFINFWATWCPPCRAELPSLQKLYNRFRDEPDVFFLLLNVDEHQDVASGKVQSFLKIKDYTFPLYSLAGERPAFYKGRLPTTVIVDKQGQIRFEKEGLADYGEARFFKELTHLIKE